MDEDKLQRRKRGRRLENEEAYKDGWIAASNGRALIIFLPLNESRGASRVISSHLIEFGCLKWETLSSSERSWRGCEGAGGGRDEWMQFLACGQFFSQQVMVDLYKVTPLARSVCHFLPRSPARLIPHLFYHVSPNLSLLHKFAPCRCLDEPKTDLRNSFTRISVIFL